MSSEEIKAEYTSSLADLTFNSRPLINVLTMLAEENIQNAPDIVEAIETHLTKVNITLLLLGKWCPRTHALVVCLLGHTLYIIFLTDIVIYLNKNFESNIIYFCIAWRRSYYQH